MAGLLGDSWDDPRSAAIMALSGGLLRGDFGGGILGANQAYQGAKEGIAKQQLMKLQMDNLASEVETRKAALAKQDQLLRLFGGAPAPAPAMPGQLGSGSFGVVAPPAGAPAIPQAPAQGGSRVGSMSLDQLAQAKLLGVDLADIYRLGQPKWENVGGNMVNTNDPSFRGGFVPQVKFDEKGGATMLQAGPDGMPRASIVPGSLDAYTAFRKADAGVAADSELVKVVGPDGAERYVSKSQVLGAARPNQPSPVLGTAKSGDADRFAILSQELEKAKASGNMADQQAIQREIARLPASARTADNPSGLSVPGFQATPTTAQSLSKDAGGKINDSWIKTSYEPAVQQAQTARDLADTISVTRTAMNNLGSTGWSTQAKAAAASVLSGLGVAPNNAKLYAANAEVFQKTAMDRLWSTLNEAKGPQTEGDANRAAKTYASLANTPQANAFILDLAQARAERDLMKARFYQEAMPIARSKGDLSEVDREWAKRAPSVFAMPTMKQWAGGVK